MVVKNDTGTRAFSPAGVCLSGLRMNACVFDRRGALLAYDAAMSSGAGKDVAVGAAVGAARASNEHVTEEEVREWLARVLARRRLAERRRRELKLVDGGANAKLLSGPKWWWKL